MTQRSLVQIQPPAGCEAVRETTSTSAPKHKWTFAPRFRRQAFGWRSQPAIGRIRGAVSEIKKAAWHSGPHLMRLDQTLATPRYFLGFTLVILRLPTRYFARASDTLPHTHSAESFRPSAAQSLRYRLMRV
jgi:hypothetical protein